MNIFSLKNAFMHVGADPSVNAKQRGPSAGMALGSEQH